jgi:hypothetical protein
MDTHSSAVLVESKGMPLFLSSTGCAVFLSSEPFRANGGGMGQQQQQQQQQHAANVVVHVQHVLKGVNMPGGSAEEQQKPTRFTVVNTEPCHFLRGCAETCRITVHIPAAAEYDDQKVFLQVGNGKGENADSPDGAALVPVRLASGPAEEGKQPGGVQWPNIILQVEMEVAVVAVAGLTVQGLNISLASGPISLPSLSAASARLYSPDDNVAVGVSGSTYLTYRQPSSLQCFVAGSLSFPLNADNGSCVCSPKALQSTARRVDSDLSNTVSVLEFTEYVHFECTEYISILCLNLLQPHSHLNPASLPPH